MELSVIIPTINSEKIIEKTIEHIHSYLKENKRIKKYELIVSLQKSKDNSLNLLKKRKDIKLVYSKEIGKGIGLNQGIKNSKYEWMLMIDDDLSYPIDFLDKVTKLTDEHDIIIGSRYLKKSKQDTPPLRLLSGQIYKHLSKILLGIKQKDIQSGLKLINKKVITNLNLPKENGYIWDSEFLYNSKKFKIKEIPIDYRYKKNQLRLFSSAPKMFLRLILLRLRNL